MSAILLGAMRAPTPPAFVATTGSGLAGRFHPPTAAASVRRHRPRRPAAAAAGRIMATAGSSSGGGGGTADADAILVVEIGTGVDLHGQDATVAAVRACKGAAAGPPPPRAPPHRGAAVEGGGDAGLWAARAPSRVGWGGERPAATTAAASDGTEAPTAWRAGRRRRRVCGRPPSSPLAVCPGPGARRGGLT